MSISFTDNSSRVETEIEDAVKAYLYEMGGELQSRIQRNSRVDTGQTKGSYSYKVIMDSKVGTCYVGSNYENAIYEEYGTGQYALNGDGRKGSWKYVKDGKGYTTTGKKPNQPMQRAFDSLSDKLESRLNTIIKSKT